MLGVQLDPTPLLASTDPDYPLIYEAVVNKAMAYHRQMHGEGG